MNITFNQASAKFGDRVVLKPLSICLTENRVGIIGLNGSGKSTFARMVNGLVLPSQGQVTTNGYDTRHDIEKVRSNVGYVFQNPANQIVLPLIKDDIALGLKINGASKYETDTAVHKVLKRLDIEHLSERRAHELSGGEVQLAALASVLVIEPDIVILDEPTNQLDLKNRNIVERTVSALSENVIVVTHDLTLLESFERVLFFHQGEIIADGNAGEVVKHYLEFAK
ncbi:energy-coupling factor ABC transporter ATP-binding protein [Brucellaceae bacterium C25G]